MTNSTQGKIYSFFLMFTASIKLPCGVPALKWPLCFDVQLRVFSQQSFRLFEQLPFSLWILLCWYLVSGFYVYFWNILYMFFAFVARRRDFQLYESMHDESFRICCGYQLYMTIKSISHFRSYIHASACQTLMRTNWDCTSRSVDIAGSTLSLSKLFWRRSFVDRQFSVMLETQWSKVSSRYPSWCNNCYWRWD